MENQDYIKANYPGLYEAIQEYNSTTPAYTHALFVKADSLVRNSFVANLVNQNSSLIDRQDSVLMMLFKEDKAEVIVTQQVFPNGIKNLRGNTLLGCMRLAWAEAFSDLLTQGTYSNSNRSNYEGARILVKEQLSNLKRGN